MTDTVPASPLPPAQPPNVSADLYKAVIGLVNQAVYLRRFAEFDRLGKTRPVWHWAAFASALNWLLFRGMWGAALIYAAVMLAALLGLLGIGRLAYDFSDPTAQLLLVGFLGLTSVLAGLYAHAAYYQFCKKKIVQTVGLASSMQDAGKRLRSEASTRKRLVVLAGLNATALGLLGWGFIAAQNTRLMPVAHTATRESAQQPEGDQSAAPASSPIQPVTSEPVPRPVTPPELVASAPVADSTVPVLKAEAPAPTPALAPAASESAR